MTQIKRLGDVEETEKNKILGFVRQMQARDHAVMFYSNAEGKRLALFTFLRAGLDHGEAAAYIAGDETREQIREAMRRFGIDVDRLEESGALRVIDYRDWYIIEGKCDIAKTLQLWKGLCDEVVAKGFKGLRVAGETACFFRNGMVKELLEYEKSLHRVLELPMSAICAYDIGSTVQNVNGELYLHLIRAHSTVIFTDSESGVIKSY